MVVPRRRSSGSRTERAARARLLGVWLLPCVLACRAASDAVTPAGGLQPLAVIDVQPGMPEPGARSRTPSESEARATGDEIEPPARRLPPPKAAPKASHSNGAPEPLRDTDRDGIPDDTDRCPDMAEDRDGYEDADGCPDPDDDLDGVPDAHDRCPTTPAPTPDGCPPGARAKP